ncbi:hypothetical protein H0X48_04930 [Candidatus Dependentiae bacterium]|nr:hypothetical protein [Candidatus Dependentiae bacterium]
MLLKISTIQDVEKLFAQDVHTIYEYNSDMLSRAKELMDDSFMQAVSHNTFNTTVQPFDTVQSLANALIARLRVLEMANSQNHLEQVIESEIERIEVFINENLAYNKQLYLLIKQYVQQGDASILSSAQKLFIKTILEDYYFNGFHLSPLEQDRLKSVYGKLGAASADFEANMMSDQHVVHVRSNQLRGIDTHYLKYLRRDRDGRFALRADTYISERCTQEETRKAFWRMAVNCAYPQNGVTLEKIIALRDESAQLLGFASFAQLDISTQMAGTIERVESFVDTIINQCHLKIKEEIAVLARHLPQDVSLTSEGRIKPWDLLYCKNYYKTHVLGVDEAVLSEYFPFEQVFKNLLLLYQEFFSVSFKQVTLQAWDPEVRALEVYKEGMLRGFILLDLFARENKYFYMLEQPIMPCVKDTNGALLPGVTVIFASLACPTQDKPSLLRRQEVASLFHEFGHAMHTLLGAQPLALQSGSRVKRDFVEMPSQMLQEWLSDEQVLAQVSCHYKTSQQLPKNILSALEQLRHYDSADTILEQCYLAYLSLNLFKEGAKKDVFAIHRRLFRRIRTSIAFSDLDHSYASFDHLTSYGAKYYSYLWAQVFALDIFDTIKKRNQAGESLESIGACYVDTIISKGGSCNPFELLESFLGRKPSMEPFLRRMSLHKTSQTD